MDHFTSPSNPFICTQGKLCVHVQSPEYSTKGQYNDNLWTYSKGDKRDKAIPVTTREDP
jgi:hypothetical protein